MSNRDRGAPLPCREAALSPQHPLSPCAALNLAKGQVLAIDTLLRSSGCDLRAVLDHAKMLWFFLDCAIEALSVSSTCQAGCTYPCAAKTINGAVDQRRAP
jgi:hypothetical protein